MTGRRLRVGVNLMWLVPGVVGGSEEYTTRLLAAVADGGYPDIELTLFACRPFVASYPRLAERFDTVVCPMSGRSKGLRVAAEATWLAFEARRRQLDLLHHAGGTLPLVRATPSMLTIHDLQPLLLPANFSRTKQTYLRWRIPASARHARLVATLTEFTRRTIVDVLHVAPERTAVAPPGYTAALSEEPVGDPARRFRLDRPFFLYPAITYPHKNHITLVRAFADVVESGLDVLLVLTHRPDVMEEELEQLARSLGVADRIRRLGHVARGDLDWLYRHAVALTFPSRFEGFGLPVLEAMGHGCPVIAADATALPEVVGESGALVDPDDVAAWAAAMRDVAQDRERREWYVEAGLARVAAFRWTSSADAVVAAYRLAAELRDP